MKSAFTLSRLAVASGLAFTAPALLAQTVAPAAKPVVAAPAVVKPAAPVPATVKPGAAPAASAATPAAAAPAGTPPVDPNAPVVPPAPPPPPLSDIIFTNGDVITFDDKRPLAQAVAVKGSKIIAVGKSKDILARWKSEGTEVDRKSVV